MLLRSLVFCASVISSKIPPTSSVDITDSMQSSAAVADGLVFVGASDHKLRALNTANGGTDFCLGSHVLTAGTDDVVRRDSRSDTWRCVHLGPTM